MLEIAGDARMFLLNRQAVVFSDASKNLFSLNTMATYIWCCAEEGLGEHEIGHRVAEAFGIPPSDAHRHVRAIRDQWAELGLLAGSPQPAGPADGRTGFGQDLGRQGPAQGLAPHLVHTERRYRILSQRFRVRFSAGGQEELVHPLVAHLAAEEPDGPESVLDVVADGAGYALILDGSTAGRADSVGQLAPAVSALMFNTVIEREPHLFGFHAAAVSRGGKAVLLPGEAGRGKTSLTAALLHAGFQYLTDDVCLLDEATLDIRGLPSSLCIKDTGRDLIARFYPALTGLPFHDRADGKRAYYLSPPGDGPWRRPTQGCPIEWVVFPRYEAGGTSVLKPLDRDDAFHRLIEHGAAGQVWNADKVKRFIDWSARLACFELSVSSLERAVGVISELCDGRRRAQE